MGAFTAFCEGVPISGGAVAVGVVLYRVRACGGWCSCWLCSDPVVAYVPGGVAYVPGGVGADLVGACLRFFLL